MPNTQANSDSRYLDRRLTAIEAAIGQTAPSWGGAVPTPTSILTILTGKTVNSTQTTIAHGLSYTPKIYGIIMTTAGTIWRSATTDGTNVYLTADANARTCEIALGR